MLTRKHYLTLPDNYLQLSADKIIGILTNQLIALDIDALDALKENANFDRSGLANTIAKELLAIVDELPDETAIDILASASTAQPLFKETSAIALLESSIRVRLQAKLQTIYECIDHQDNKAANLAARDLVAETKKLSHPLAWQLLSQALLHPLFNSHESAMTTLRHGINLEAHNRSPLSVTPTYAYLRHYEIEHANDVAKFLSNPNLVLNWLDKATALDASKLIHHFFVKDTEHYNSLVAAQGNADITQEQKDAAAVLLALVSPTQPDEHERVRLQQLADQLEQQYEHRQLKSVQASLAVLISDDVNTLQEANSHYLNLNSRNLSGCDLTGMQMRGAAMSQADLCYATLCATNLKAAQLQDANLSGADLSKASLIEANLRGSILSVATLHDTRLQGADLSYADLSLSNLRGANLTNAILEETNFQDADFFCAKDFQSELALNARLNSLQQMLVGHPYLAILRDAITNSFISHMQSQHVDNKTALKYLQLAHKHTAFSMHGELNAAKATANAVFGAGVAIANTFSTFFTKEKCLIPSHEAYAMQTPAQEKIAREISRYPMTERKSIFQRPPAPTYKPAPVPEESVRNSK